ncbi:hypothetical protein EDEG_02597 [Edhazardia aedis USNM 41457]|uniref:Uncharacterized protein n=1 Tax=Edhazardia aedis (strain USNM 41457) TaxID=1003232 RepID=J9DK80_EDHAE|nr:hypothetical protein EDEG_02597 [Edhazardia aedis USNM 41457]|eukprot:EJW03015.1 hypothetical protein EDEG_02597 [Edhazardia aedis USNM 41457]
MNVSVEFLVKNIHIVSFKKFHCNIQINLYKVSHLFFASVLNYKVDIMTLYQMQKFVICLLLNLKYSHIINKYCVLICIQIINNFFVIFRCLSISQSSLFVFCVSFRMKKIISSYFKCQIIINQ